MITLTEIQTRILEALAHYRYLTHSQMLRLEIGSASFLRHSTRRLREKGDQPLIGSIRYPFAPHEGRLEQVHHLTPAGAALLSEIKHDDTIQKQFKPVTAVYHRDYWHRKHTIDFQIALTRTIQHSNQLELTTFDRYFDKTGANRSNQSTEPLRSKTRIDLNTERHLIPDANIILTRPTDPEHPLLYTLEVAHGQDTKRILRQIQRHAEVLEKRLLSTTYQLPQAAHHVLFIFSDYQLLRAVRTRFVDVTAALPFSICYRFGYFQYLVQDPLRCWKLPTHVSDDWYHLITGKPVKEQSTPSNSKS